jgi:uncharacterized repeat protein (TIGR03837 family)
MPRSVSSLSAPAWLWDVFCTVIDNHGDLGVCWRLACQLRDAGHRVRLWVDDASALAWMAPGAVDGHEAGITVLPWPDEPGTGVDLALLEPAQVWVEAFGCTIPNAFVATHVAARQAQHMAPPVWLNLEYLSAEPWVARMHGLPSPVLHGPAQGYTKWFYYPGFTPATGGLLRESWMPAQQAHVASPQMLQISLFCYEPPALLELLAHLGQSPRPYHLWVCAGRPTQAVRAACADQPQLASALQWTALPYMPQPRFDALLESCQLNFVRGEDSLVRALWAGQPLVWHIYPQDDNAHVAKLDAFLDWLEAPASLRAFHHRWNGLPTPQAQAPLAWPDAPTLQAWHECIAAARQRLLEQPSLVEQLVSFVAKKL